MRFLSDSNRIAIDADELVSLARRRSGAYSLPEDRAEMTEEAYAATVCLHGQIECGELCFEITARAAVAGEEVTVVRPTAGDPAAPTPAERKQGRGEGFLAAYLLTASSYVERPTVRVLYVNGERRAEESERPTPMALRRFAEKLCSTARERAAAEIDRATRRLPTMKQVPFPYRTVRESQRELISAAYRALSTGGRLYACAPTGTGKTISTLFPAVRALGAGVVDKIFYFTAKATTAKAAAEAAERLAASGAELRVLLLSAKERICRHSLACREGAGESCPLSRYAPSREDEAARELLSTGKTVITADDLVRIGEEKKLCPYELSLRFAELADIVICDYNYLFDPRVRLRRFFSVDTSERYAFLIDEAHNLVDRARELYSLDLPLSALEGYRTLFSKTPTLGAALDEATDALRSILLPLVSDSVEMREGVRRGFARQSEMPPGLDDALMHLLVSVEDALSSGAVALSDRRELTRISYELRGICERLALYSKRYTSFILQHGDALTYRALCLDPSEIISDCLSLGAASILFSATLTPTEYYKTVLGGDARSDCLDLPSPFDRDHLCVAILDKISTRYSDRDGSLLSVARAILTAVKAKPGNYLVFCPSFSYLEALSGAIARLAHGLRVICQSREMTAAARAEFLDAFSEENKTALIGLAVLGGIFGESVDLAGRRLIGSIVIGVGLPQPTPEREAIREYYDELTEAGREYAYHYPGMNRVLQAAGRVIRRETDRGVILLIDDRFAEPLYRKMIPAHWHSMKYVGNLPSLTHLLAQFWNNKSKDS